MTTDCRILVLLEHKNTQGIVSPSCLERLEKLADVTPIESPRTLSSPELSSLLGSHDIAITGWGSPRLPPDVTTDPASRLRYVCHMTGSVRTIIPPDYFTAPRVTVTNWGNVISPFIAEAALTLILACGRRLKHHGMRLDRRLKTTAMPGQDTSLAARWRTLFRAVDVHHEWQQAQAVGGFSVFGTTVGFYGLGNSAKELARLLSPFDVTFRYFDPFAVNDTPYPMEKVDDLRALFRTSAVVTIHAALNKETECSVNRDVLGDIPDDAILVNTARGGIVDERDLLAAMEEKNLWVGLDVFAEEPLPYRSPMRRHPRIVMTPHTADNIGRRRASLLSDLVVENVAAFISGRRPRFVVTREQYERMT